MDQPARHHRAPLLGYYMLFAINSKGVPSMGQMILIE
jgi:hypothetical protein